MGTSLRFWLMRTKGGYRGFLSLEPHLASVEQLKGFSGPVLFTMAVDALWGSVQGQPDSIWRVKISDVIVAV